jgi:hypothetical protein
MKLVNIKELKEKERLNALEEIRLLASFKNRYIIGYKVKLIFNFMKHSFIDSD